MLENQRALSGQKVRIHEEKGVSRSQEAAEDIRQKESIIGFGLSIRGLQNEDPVVQEDCCLSDETPAGLPPFPVQPYHEASLLEVTREGQCSCHLWEPHRTRVDSSLQFTWCFPRHSLIATLAEREAYTHFTDGETGVQRGYASSGRSEPGLLRPHPGCSHHTKQPPLPSLQMSSLCYRTFVTSPLCWKVS